MPLIAPMLATAGTVPINQQSEFAFDLKWDGVRLITYLDAGEVTGFTRNNRNVTETFPEIQELADLLPDSTVLDGEIVAFNEAGAVHFGTLQRRMHVTRPADVVKLQAEVPVVYVVFDLLQLGGKQLSTIPFIERRRMLDDVSPTAPHIQTPPLIDTDLDRALEVSKHMRAEGIIAKRRTSTYLPGRRSTDWIKIKHVKTQEVIIGGWRPGKGHRVGHLGSLLLGVRHDGDLRYCGRCGTGFSEATLRQLRVMLEPLARATTPFTPAPPREVERDAYWVEPVLVGEVAFTEWTTDGILRHPAWRGIRPDKDAKDITPEH
ncbi:MAG: hypothetical protein HOQ05_00480 [Corynebacteriales bacterium]|nr:hypothetical protein [Mycobacteriales bacterium]